MQREFENDGGDQNDFYDKLEFIWLMFLCGYVIVAYIFIPATFVILILIFRFDSYIILIWWVLLVINISENQLKEENKCWLRTFNKTMLAGQRRRLQV